MKKCFTVLLLANLWLQASAQSTDEMKMSDCAQDCTHLQLDLQVLVPGTYIMRIEGLNMAIQRIIIQ